MQGLTCRDSPPPASSLRCHCPPTWMRRLLAFASLLCQVDVARSFLEALNQAMEMLNPEAARQAPFCVAMC